MELKLTQGTKVFVRGDGLNRTFMELKCESLIDNHVPEMVLIEPLWN